MLLRVPGVRKHEFMNATFWTRKLRRKVWSKRALPTDCQPGVGFLHQTGSGMVSIGIKMGGGAAARLWGLVRNTEGCFAWYKMYEDYGQQLMRFLRVLWQQGITSDITNTLVGISGETGREPPYLLTFIRSRHLVSGGSNFYSWCVTPHSSPSRGYWQCLTIFNILNFFIIIN